MARRKTRRSKKSQYTLSGSGCRDKSGAFVPVYPYCTSKRPRSMQSVSGINSRRKIRCRDSRGRFTRCRSKARY